MVRVTAAAALFVVLAMGRPVAAPTVDRFWYAPNPGTMDLIRMFEHPEEWAHARQIINVFQFTEQATHTPPDSIVGPNFYDALARAGVFAKLKQWGLKTAVGVGAVKSFYCTPDASGMNAAIADAENAIRVIANAGGQVNYLAMDDPFAGGQEKGCDSGSNLTPTADRLQVFISTIRRDFPAVQIGQMEAYPTFAPAAFQQMMDLLKARGVLPAFLQIDTDIRAVRPPRNLTDDMHQLRSIAQNAGVPFGVIVWGYNGDADALFARDAMKLAEAFMEAFPTWDQVPDQISVQSWSPSSTGLLITPSNLPENRASTLTYIVNDLYRRFRGGSPSPTTGIAVPRR